MLSAFWALGEERPVRRNVMVGASGIPQAEFAAAIVRLRDGEAAEQVLDDRFVDAFAIAGTAEDCLTQAVIYRRAGVDKLALNFVGSDPTRDIQYLGGGNRKLMSRPAS
jgi:5,10-methylenetetrahydromethanopterin reductase